MKSKIVSVLLVCILVFSTCACGGSGDGEDGSSTEKHIYDSASVVDVMNGVGTEKIGECSVIEAKSTDITDEVLEDWYFNYVEQNDFNYCVIVYTDANDNSGVFTNGSFVEKGATLEKQDDGSYMLADSDNAITYWVVDGHLKASN